MAVNLNPDDFIITRKRKLYKFALFANSPLCFEVEQWQTTLPTDVLELGAGTGLFGVSLAEHVPASHVLAVDVKADRLQTGAQRALEKKLTNIHFLRARADQLLELLPVHSLQKVWVTFPDPFPKERSAKNRLTHPKFLAVYQTLLASGGALYFKTDAVDLFTWSLEQLVREGWRIDELSFDLHGSDLPDDYKVMTTYETRYTGEGLSIHFVRAVPPIATV